MAQKDDEQPARSEWIDRSFDEHDPPPGHARQPRVITDYLAHVVRSLNYLEFGDPGEYLAAMSIPTFKRARLADLWTPPLVTQIALGGSRGADQGLSSVELPLSRVLFEAPELTQVILAGPGAGKSTVCRYLACQLAAGNRPTAMGLNLVPIVVPVRKLDFREEQDLDDVLIEAALGQLANLTGVARKLVKTELLDNLERAWLIVDGLDEAPPKQDARASKGRQRLDRRRVIAAISEFRERHRSARILITSREAEYTERGQSIIPQAFHYLLGSFGPDQILIAVRNWHREAALCVENGANLLPRWELRERLLNDLLRDDADVGQLAQVPLLLNMMQVVFKPEDDFPRTISNLVDKAVQFLLFDNPRARTNGQGDRWFKAADEKAILEALRRIAFDATERRLSSRSSGFSPGQIFEAVDSSECLAGDRELDDAGRVAALVRHIQQGHGLVVEVSTRVYDFSHNVFREVLAGQWLDSFDPPEFARLSSQLAWLSPIRYWAGWKAGQRGSESEACAMAQELLSYADKGSNESRPIVLLAVGEMVTELTRPGSKMKNWAAVRELRGKAVRRLSALLIDLQIEFFVRVRIGDVIGSLSDPRIIDEAKVAVSGLALVVIPGREMIAFGRLKPHEVKREKYLECPPCPPVVGSVDTFEIGQSPVTNAEYYEFVADGGYDNIEYWKTPEAALWVKRDSAFIGSLRDQVREAGEKHYQTEIDAGRLSFDDLDDLAGKLVARSEPLYWHNPRFNRGNQPVVGVNYWESLAYCAWLESKLQGGSTERVSVVLPTEFEWEYAARLASASPFPWGSEINMDIPDAHVRDSEIAGIGRTCAVGLFPWASWEGGPLDMVGNVWEWTLSSLAVYHAGVVEDIPPRDGMVERVVRGSSWLSHEPESVEVTFRSFDPPFNAYEDLGFRVVVKRRPTNESS